MVACIETRELNIRVNWNAGPQMAIADNAHEYLAVFFPEIADRRKADPVLDEICRDFEKLAAMLETAKESSNHDTDNLQKDLRMTIRALQEEIRDRLKKPTS